MPEAAPAHTPSLALVLGGTGGIGAALTQRLREQGHTVLAVGRGTAPALDPAPYRWQAALERGWSDAP